jgi:hypothetical protein
VPLPRLLPTPDADRPSWGDERADEPRGKRPDNAGPRRRALRPPRPGPTPRCHRGGRSRTPAPGSAEGGEGPTQRQAGGRPAAAHVPPAPAPPPAPRAAAIVLAAPGLQPSPKPRAGRRGWYGPVRRGSGAGQCQRRGRGKAGASRSAAARRLRRKKTTLRQHGRAAVHAGRRGEAGGRKGPAGGRAGRREDGEPEDVEAQVAPRVVGSTRDGQACQDGFRRARNAKA